jgi:cytochrome c oxidase subunit 2
MRRGVLVATLAAPLAGAWTASPLAGALSVSPLAVALAASPLAVARAADGPSAEATAHTAPGAHGTGSTSTSTDAPTRRVEITAHRYAFDPARIEVQQGETVELVLHSTDTDHGFQIKALGVKLGIPKGGAAVTATFVARQAGRFPIECSEYCGSGHKRMRAELVVEEARQ